MLSVSERRAELLRPVRIYFEPARPRKPSPRTEDCSLFGVIGSAPSPWSSTERTRLDTRSDFITGEIASMLLITMNSQKQKGAAPRFVFMYSGSERTNADVQSCVPRDDESDTFDRVTDRATQNTFGVMKFILRLTKWWHFYSCHLDAT